MAVFSKFAVSVAAVAVGYEEESLAIASALQLKLEMIGKIEEILGNVPSVRRGAGIVAGVATLMASAESKDLRDLGTMDDKASIVEPLTVGFKKSSKQIAPAKSEQGLAKKQSLTKEQITEIVDAFQSQKVLDEALDKIKCEGFADKKAMWKLFGLLRNASNAQKEKFSQKVAELDEAIRSTQEFKRTFDNVINDTESTGTGSKCDLKVVLEQLAEDQRKAVKQAAEEFKTVAPSTCVKTEEESVYQNPDWWGGMGLLLMVMCCIVCGIAACCCCKSGDQICCCLKIR